MKHFRPAITNALLWDGYNIKINAAAAPPASPLS